MDIRCGFWNILADGLGHGEFITNGGDEVCVDWSVRKKGILSVLNEMFNVCDIVVTVENDHFHWLLNKLNKTHKIGGVYYIESNLSSPSTARKHRDINLSYSFKDECGEYAHSYSKIYNFEENDPYTSDDGIAIYYKKDVVQFISANRECINQCGSTYTYCGDEQYIIAQFKLVNCETSVHICGAHLSSGEGIRAEMRRAEKMKEILGEINNSPNGTILLDQNCSDMYEKDYNFETCRRVIANYEYKNLIDPVGSECLKMRHSHGGQPTKYGQFVFDTIDGILIKNDTIGQQEKNLFGFGRYPMYLRSILLDWRINKRNVLREYSCNVHNIRHRPNYEKHPQYDIDKTEENRWSSDMNKNTTHSLDRYLGYHGVPELSQYPHDEQIPRILKYLYPNPLAPSDHPPICATIRVR